MLQRLTAAGVVACLACSNGDPNGPEGPDCITIEGAGQLTGDINKLTGDGVFTFDGVDRDVEVGLYLFSTVPEADGLRVDTQYQFNFDNGDTFLTRHEAFFEPSLEPDRYTFRSPLLVVAGAGLFADQVGKTPMTLTAVIQYGPPLNPGDLPTTEETFNVGGNLCPG